MPLAFRTVFYDAAEVAALDRRPWPDFDWTAVLRAQSCFEGGGYQPRKYRTEREKLMVDPSENEVQSLMAASPAGGAYLDRIGKSDLATMTEDEWMSFLEVIVSAFQDKMAELHSPFAVLRSSHDPISINPQPAAITAADCPY